MQALEPIGSFGDNTSSAACWELAKAWLRECETKHKGCCSHGSTRAYSPTRLIKIDRRGAEHQLCLSVDHPSKVEYLTLSHRWGTRPALSLTTSKINLWSGNIPFEDLPRTYRYAVVATNRLGFKYLWIDALCIVQDSKEDWYQEASAMSDVYTNSICNLPALHAQDNSDGLFSTRKPDENFPIVAGLTSTKRPQRVLHIEPNDYWDDQITRKELNRRGWVLQERLLAPRILHFGKTQLLWECRMLHASESFPSGIGDEHLRPDLTPLMNLPRQSENNYGVFNNYMGKRWEEIISMYSASELTVSSDRLVAISGVAKLLGNRLNNEYCAGLWKSSIIPQLAWRMKAGAGVRPSSYRAPSWSWASVDGYVGFEDSVGFHKLAFAESVEVTTVTDDAFGAVRDDVLRLRGQVFHGIHGNAKRFRQLASEITHVDCLPDGSIQHKIYPDSDSGLSDSELEGFELEDSDSADSESALDNLCCIPIMAKDYGRFVDFVSLILEPTEGNRTYERWGLLLTTCHGMSYPDSKVLSLSELQRVRNYQSFRESNSVGYLEQVVTIV